MSNSFCNRVSGGTLSGSVTCTAGASYLTGGSSDESGFDAFGLEGGFMNVTLLS